MNLLLDTHALLWWLEDNPSLSREARAAISDGNRAVFVSAVTAWEIVIKKRLGKLDAPDTLEEALAANAFQELPVTIAHALAAGALPAHHTDPFDRMLVAQATLENLTLVTRDENIQKYPVAIIAA
ncbi:MAG TPA: type II toxin-antitoxin system VapC family toxin [Candidatus Hydrogenedentes bacterium]|nr:type II toxin-antitoxin system VapC family toxin [Candidatus Hydrogenedentota bacterium]